MLKRARSGRAAVSPEAGRKYAPSSPTTPSRSVSLADAQPHRRRASPPGTPNGRKGRNDRVSSVTNFADTFARPNNGNNSGNDRRTDGGGSRLKWGSARDHSGRTPSRMSKGSRATDVDGDGSKSYRHYMTSPGQEFERFECSLAFFKSSTIVIFSILRSDGSLQVIEFICALVTLVLVSFQCSFEMGDGFSALFIIGYLADVLVTIAATMRLRRLFKKARRTRDDGSASSASRRRELRAKRASSILMIVLSTPFDIVLWFPEGTRSWVRWVRLVHLIPSKSRITSYFHMLEHSPICSFLKARLLRTTVYFFASAHLIGCVFFLLARQDAPLYHDAAVWRTENNNQNNTAYTRLLYHAILSLSSVHTDGSGVNRSFGGGLDWEYWFGMLSTILTNLVFMYVSSNLTSIMLRTFQRIEEYRSKLTMVIVYLKRNRLSSRLSKLVLDHFRHAYENRDGELEEESLLKQLPLTLSREVRHEKNMRVLRRAPILVGCEKAVLRLLAILVRQVTFMPEEIVCTEGDVIRELLVLQSGALQRRIEEPSEDDDDEEEEEEKEGDPIRSALGAALQSSVEIEGKGSPTGNNCSPVIPLSNLGGDGDLQVMDTDSFAMNSPRNAVLMQSQRRPGMIGKLSQMGTQALPNLPFISKGDGKLDAKFAMSRRGSKSDMGSVTQSMAMLGKQTLYGLGFVEPTPEAQPFETTIQIPGKTVCEIAFFFGIRQPTSLIALKRSTCLLLDMDSWKLVAKEFPQDAHRIQKRALEMARETEPELVKNVQLKPISDEQRHVIEDLFNVVASGDEVGVEALVDPQRAGTDPSELDYAGNTPLHVAALLGHIAVVRALIKHGAPVNALDGAGKTPLAVAMSKGNNEIALAIHSAGGQLGWDEATTASELCDAAKVGNLNKLNMFIICGANVGSADYDKRTALHLAASMGNARFIETLLEYGASVNAIDRWGGTPLRDAVKGNHRKVALSLLAHKGDLNFDEATCASELCELARNGDAKRLQLLIDCNCNVDAADYDSRCCMHLASSVGNKVIVQLLLKAGASINFKDRWGGTPLRDAIRHGHLDLAESLISCGAALDMPDADAAAELCDLAREGKLERMHLLLEGKANIDAMDYDNRTCLHLAASTGNLLVVQSLVQRGCQISIKDRWGGTPLGDAIREGHNEVAKLLIRSNADLGYDEEKSAGTLCELARQGNMTMLHVLLSAGCDVNAADYDSRTCLHLCASEAGIHLIEELIRFSANLDARDRWGGTPLADAVREGHVKVALLLHSKGASLGFDETKTATWLSECARAGDLEKIELLLNCGASVNAADNDMRTCLHLASSTGNLKVVEALIASSANLNVMDRWGGTPLSDAIREGHRQVAAFIREAGGEVMYDEAKTSGELCEMARSGDIEGIKLLLSGGCSVNAADYDLRTCIHLAASSGNLVVAQTLLDASCTVNVKDRWGGTPLADAVREGHEHVARLLRSAGAELGFADEGMVANELCARARVGDCKGIHLLLEAGACVNACDYDGRTCLHLAACTGNISVLRELIAVSANVNAKDRWGSTPFSDAVREGHTQIAVELRAIGGLLLYDEARASGELCEMARTGDIEGIKMLLSGGCSVNAADYDLRTCIHLAASTGNLVVVQTLLEASCDLKVKDRWGGTPLADSVREGHEHVARLLRSAGAELGFVDDGVAANELCERARVGDCKGIKLLLEAGSPVNAQNYDGRTCLHLAALTGNINAMTTLIEAGADPNVLDADLRSCLHLVASSGQLSVTKELLGAPGLDLNLKDRWGSTPLSLALLESHFEVANALIAKGSKLLFPRERAVFELCGAARRGQTMMIRLLIEGGVDPNARDYDDRGCLMLAASLGNVHVVKMLLDSGADINAVDRWGGSALSDAVREGHSHVMKILLANGAKVFWDRLTAAGKLCDAAAEGNIEKLEQYLDCGIDPMTCDYDQRTALHLAASAGHLHAVEHLLGRNVNVHFKDRWGGTALDDAEREGHQHIVKFLKRAMEVSELMPALAKKGVDGLATSATEDET